MKVVWNRHGVVAVVCFVTLSAGAAMLTFIPNLEPFEDETGAVSTFNTAGAIHKDNPFFQSLGTNGRTCETCHEAEQAFSISAKGVQELYNKSHGEDPLFAAFDGANCRQKPRRGAMRTACCSSGA